MEDSEIVNKLAAARTRLILDKPFLGALVLRLPLVKANPNWCESVNTDARKLYYNEDYIHDLTPAETQFVLAKQALHCALSHFARRGHRIKHRWDLACDYAVHPMLLEEGLIAPPNTLIDKEFDGMTAEEIYPCLLDKDDEDDDPESSEDEDQSSESSEGSGDSESDQAAGDEADQGGSEQTSGQVGADEPQPLNQAESEILAEQWQQRLAGAAQQAMQAGKLSSGMARLVEIMLQPKLPWRMLLARYMVATARDDYSYTRPSTRREGPAIYPSLRSSQLNIVVALDVSGSIDDDEMSEFLSEVDAIKGQLRARISLLACDTQLTKGSPWIYEPWDSFDLQRQFTGGGGTDFRPVFDWVERQDMQPDLLIYFTDCMGDFPKLAPQYPLIWLVKGREKPPFGQRIQLN